MSAEAAYTAMASGAFTGAEPGQKVRVRDADRVKEFHGQLMHRVSTEVAHKPQWLEIELWRFTDGTCRYLLHFIGRSVLVHREGSDCNTGVPTPASQLPPDSEPCYRCRPSLSDASGDAIFEAETDRHKVEVCDGRTRDSAGQLLLGADGEPLGIQDETEAWRASAREVLRVLRESWHRRPESAGTLSAPAQRLIDTVAGADEAIRAATQVVEQL